MSQQVDPASTEPVWVGTSWKMTKTLAEATAYVAELLSRPIPAGVQPFILPPHTALATVRDQIPAGSPILLGAQNAHPGPEGGFTGEISMRMAADAGAVLVEVGHSERRAHFAETDHTVAAKVVAALDHGLVPLVCVGEPWWVRQAGDAEGFVAAQVSSALAQLPAADVRRVLVAYEPVWAVGQRGRPAMPDQVAPVVARIKQSAERAGAGLRGLFYGGSVDRANARDLLEIPGVDGLFIGRAAWAAADFAELLALCAAAPRRAPARQRSSFEPTPHRSRVSINRVLVKK